MLINVVWLLEAPRTSADADKGGEGWREVEGACKRRRTKDEWAPRVGVVAPGAKG